MKNIPIVAAFEYGLRKGSHWNHFDYRRINYINQLVDLYVIGSKRERAQHQQHTL